MIFDTSCYPTQVVDLAWRHDGEPFTGERLLKMMDGPYTVCGKPRRIDKAFIQPPQGNTIYTDGIAELTGRDAIQAYMRYTVELVQRYPDRFVGCFVYNPRYGTPTAPPRSSGTPRSSASGWSSCRPTCTPTGPTARSTGCARP